MRGTSKPSALFSVEYNLMEKTCISKSGMARPPRPLRAYQTYVVHLGRVRPGRHHPMQQHNYPGHATGIRLAFAVKLVPLLLRERDGRVLFFC